jgi:hypothetical protein
MRTAYSKAAAHRLPPASSVSSFSASESEESEASDQEQPKLGRRLSSRTPEYARRARLRRHWAAPPSWHAPLGRREKFFLVLYTLSYIVGWLLLFGRDVFGGRAASTKSSPECAMDITRAPITRLQGLDSNYCANPSS